MLRWLPLVLLVAVLPARAQETSLALDPRLRLGMPITAAVQLARGLGLAAGPAETVAGSPGRQVVVATPPGAACTPRGAALRCEGLRLYSDQAGGRGAQLSMVESFQPLARPRPSAPLLQRAVALHGPPQEMWREYRQQDGRELFLLRYRWLRDTGMQQELILTLQPDQPARGRQRLPPEPLATGVGLVLHPVR